MLQADGVCGCQAILQALPLCSDQLIFSPAAIIDSLADFNVWRLLRIAWLLVPWCCLRTVGRQIVGAACRGALVGNWCCIAKILAPSCISLKANLRSSSSAIAQSRNHVRLTYYQCGELLVRHVSHLKLTAALLLIYSCIASVTGCAVQ